MHKRKQTKKHIFYNSLLRWNDVAAGTEQQAVFFFIVLTHRCHEMSDKHRGNILTLKMQYPLRRECGETSPPGVLGKRQRRRIIKLSVSAHHNILINTNVQSPLNGRTSKSKSVNFKVELFFSGDLQMLIRWAFSPLSLC